MNKLRVYEVGELVKTFQLYRLEIFFSISLTSNSIVSHAITEKHALVSFSKTANSARPSDSRYFLQSKTHSCMFIRNCTRNYTITYTYHTRLRLVPYIRAGKIG